MARRDYVTETFQAKRNNKKSNNKKKENGKTQASRDYVTETFRAKAMNSIGLDTLSSDLTSLSKTLNKVYSGWQTKETMQNTLSSVQSLYDRVGKYQEYQKKYGGTDLSDIQNSLKSTIKDWDDLSKQYGLHKDATSYNNAVKTAKEKAKEIEGQKTADIDALQTEISDLEGVYKTAIKYQTRIDNIKSQKNTAEARSHGLNLDNEYSPKINTAETELNDYLRSVGYSSIDDIQKSLGEKKAYKKRAEWVQKGIQMASVGDETSENYDKEFGEKSKYIPTEDKLIEIRFGNSNPKDIYKYINSDNKTKVAMVGVEPEDNPLPIYKSLDKMTTQQKLDFNYYFNEFGEKKAMEYYGTISEELDNLVALDIMENLEGKTFEELSYGMIAGLDQFGTGMKNLSNFSDEYIPVNTTQQLSGTVREDLRYNHGNIGQIGYDLINTTSNMLPSILTSTMVGWINPAVGSTVGAGLMGASASGNAYQEMLNLGYDKGQARTYSALVGVSEAALQKVMGGIGKLGGVSGKLANAVKGINNGFARFAIRFGGSVASESLEEGLQEILNPLFMNLATNGVVEANVDWSEVAYSALLGALSGGFFEGRPVAKSTMAESRINKREGLNIKANERAADLFDLASISPETSSAYETYTMFANKGISAENVSDYHLGLLAADARLDAQEVLDSKKTTEEQRKSAQKTLDDLAVYSQANVQSKTGSAQNIDKRFFEKFDAESIVQMIESGLESAEDTDAHRLATEYKAKIDNYDALAEVVNKQMNGEELTAEETKMLAESKVKLSATEIAKLIDANDRAIRAEETNDIATQLVERGETEEIADIVARKMRGERITTEEAEKLMESEVAPSVIAENSNGENVNEQLLETAKSMDKERGALFVSLYDGKTDIDAYTNAFNLAVTKAEKNFGIKELLEHKSVLSNEQVSKIYGEIRIKVDQNKRLEFQKLSERTANLKAYKGIIDDSVIDYNNTSAEGKVNWKEIKPERRKEIIFIKGLAQATGMNLEIIKDGKERGINGSYSISGNTITIDIFAEGRLNANELIDAIIPTMSHELTHWMEKKSPVLFRKICDVVFQTLERADGLTERERITKEINRTLAKEYKKNYESENEGKTISLDEAFKLVPDDVRLEAYEDSHRIEVARSEIVARACEDMLSRSKVGRELFNSLTEKEKKTLTEKIKDIIQNIKDWISNALGLYESTSDEAKKLRRFDEEMDKLAALWDEMLKESVEVNQALEKSGAFEHKKNTSEGGVLFAFTDYVSGDSKFIIDAIKRNVDLISVGKKFSVESEEIDGSIRKSDYVFNIFKSQGEIAFNPTLGKVELSHSGAKKTVFHGFGGEKLTATKAVKDVIEHGDIIKESKNYGNKGVDRYVIAARGEIDTNDSIVGVIVNSYPNNKNSNAKFYLHEAIIIEKDSPFMTAPQLSVDAMSESNSNNSIRNSERNVNIKFSEQSKLASNLNPTEDKDMRYSERENSYSYESIIAKPDMKLTVLDSTVPNNRADIVHQAIKNARSVGFTNENGNAVVRVRDVDTDIIVPKRSIVHGLDRRTSTQAPVMVKIGEVLKEAIRVNELNPKSENAKNTYVLIGAAMNKNNELYIASFVVNRFSNEVAEIDVLYSANAKKESAALLPKITEKSATPTDSTISIAELLDNVNKHFPDILPESVLRHYNHSERPEGTLGESALYSERDDTTVYDRMGETERIRKENEKFKAEIERLKERLKIERKVTHGNYFNENQLGTVAGHLRNISKSNYDKVKLMKSLKDVYSFIAHSENLTWEEVFSKCYDIADAMLAEAKPEIIVDDYSKYLLREIRNSRISLDEEQKKEAQHHFGKNWNRHFMGKVIISNDGINIDAKWQEWSQMYPEIFDADTNSQDMIAELYDIIGSLKDASETIVEYEDEEQKRWLANEIYNQYWNVSPIKTTADKYDKQIKRLNFEHRNAMKELRDDYNTRLKEQRIADDIHYTKKIKKLVAEIRERKDREIALAKQHGREMLNKHKENAEKKTRIQSITANSLSLNEMLIKNSKDKHIPEIMKGPVASLLQAINFSSKRMLEKGEPTKNDISLSKSLSKVKDMMVKATNAHEELVELYGHGLDEDIEKMVDNVDTIMRTVGDNEYVLNKMTLTDLQTLDKTVKTIRHVVNKLNKFHTVHHAKGIANLSQESMLYLDSLGKGKIYDGIRGKSQKLLNWGNALPYYVFKRYGEGGMKVYEALQDGWDKFAFNTKKIIDYANEAYTSKEVKEWSEDVKTFNILIPTNGYEALDEDYEPQYQEIQLTVPQIMSMYCLNKREQARGHLFQGGIRVADIKTKKGEIISQSEGVIFTEKDVQAIFDSLTERQKEVADKLQEFMNTVCADWGNDVSMARFGYKAFGEENYFPIQSDKNNLAVNDETEQTNSLFKLLNMSFTKSTVDKANNRIVISDIFDVFAQHTSDMAKYNALALPVLDAFKWYNYTEKEDVAEGTFKTSGVKQSIERAFGKDGQNYFTTFLKDINGQQEVSRDTLGKSFFTNAKIAAVGANLRVVLLQPTSYVRASAVIDNKYLTKALIHKPKVKKAETHCGIALWKSMGYYDTNIQRGVEAQIKHADTWKDKAIEISMKGAEVADKITWGYLWNACELEVRDIRKDLKVGSQEFYDAIAKRLREVIYATQVVDSTMTRSQIMRSSDGYDKMLTSFASEPTLSYNMLQDAYIQYKLDARQMGKKEARAKNAKRIGRILYAYTMTNAVAALVESAFDAYRDDDDEEMDMIAFLKLYFKNFALDMSIGNKIPFVKELYSVLQGYSSSRLDTQWAQYLYSALNAKKPSKNISFLIRLTSQLFGLPFYNMYRDTMATLNKLELFTTEDLNEMFGGFEN